MEEKEKNKRLIQEGNKWYTLKPDGTKEEYKGSILTGGISTECCMTIKRVTKEDGVYVVLEKKINGEWITTETKINQ